MSKKSASVSKRAEPEEPVVLPLALEEELVDRIDSSLDEQRRGVLTPAREHLERWRAPKL